MKNKKLIYAVGIVVGAYLLFKNKSKIFGKKASAEIDKSVEGVEKVVQGVVKPKSKLVYRGIVKYISGAENTQITGQTNLMYVIGKMKNVKEYDALYTQRATTKPTQNDDYFVRNSKGIDYTIIGVNNQGVIIKGDNKVAFPKGSQFEIRKIA